MDSKNNILRKKEWKGSILKQLDGITNFLSVNVKDGYSIEALIEALKINFISPGRLYNLPEL